MTPSRQLRSFAAFLTLSCVLLSQLAVAAYACPGAQGMAMAATQLEGSPGSPCGDGVDDPQPALCSAHCQQGDQSLDKPAAPVVAAAAPASPLPGFGTLDLAPVAVPVGEQRSLLARITAPRLAVRNCCLRI